MPEWRSEIARRLRSAKLRASEQDVIDELSQHLDDRYAELRASGRSGEDAYRAVLEELDGDDLLGVRVKSSRRRDAAAAPAPGAGAGRNALLNLGGDMRHGFRVLRRSPGFTLIAVVVIALGVGANTAIFSGVSELLLQPMAGVRAPSELASVYTSDYSGPRFGASSYPDVEAIRESGVFAGVTAYRPSSFSIAIGERGRRVLGEAVDASYFEVLGMEPALGRLFGTEEAGAPGTSQVVVISHELWQREFGGAADVVGRPLRVNGSVLTIIGVVPPEYTGALRGVDFHVWVPFSGPQSVLRLDVAERGDRGMFVLGRMPPGTTVAMMQERLAVVASRLHAEYPDYWTDINNQSRVFTVLSEADSRVPPQARAAVMGVFGLLTSVAIIVLLIACTNVANLQLARASVRHSEIGVRLALGATRGRIVRQLLVENLMLALPGGALGVLLAVWLVRALNSASLPVPIPVTLDIGLDYRALLFAAAISILAGLVFGIAPALQASRSAGPMIRGADAAPRARLRLRNILVVVQVAASIVLLCGSAMFLRSLLEARRIETGLEDENIVVIPFEFATEGYTLEEAQRLYERLEERIAAIGGVESVTFAEMIPLSGGWGRRFVVVDGYTPAEGEDMEVLYNGVGPGYFETLGIPVVQGRTFKRSDRDGAPEVVIVNEAFVRRFWPGTVSALGRRVSLNGREGPFAEVVGVVPDGKYRSLTEDPTPYIYYSALQRPSFGLTMHVRTAVPPENLMARVREEIRAAIGGMPMPQITTLSQQIGIVTLPQRLAAAGLAVLGFLAILIASLGLYGVIAFTVARRTREFGIRTALGAAAADIQRMVLRQGLGLALAGAAIGIVLAIAAGTALRAMLLVSPADPLALGGVIVILLAAAVLACWVPARRATRVDPTLTLRVE